MIKLETKKKITLFDFLIFWGFILFNLGALGLIQIAILEGESLFFLISGFTFLIGIIILIISLILDKKGKF